MTALPQDQQPRRLRLAVLVPLLLFLVVAALFMSRLIVGRDPSLLPSVLIGHPAPQTALPPVAGLVRDGQPVPGLAPADFAGAVTVLNVWASWCIPCHDEAPLLMRLADDKRIRVVGMNQKDEADNARRGGRPRRGTFLTALHRGWWRAAHRNGTDRHDRLPRKRLRARDSAVRLQDKCDEIGGILVAERAGIADRHGVADACEEIARRAVAPGVQEIGASQGRRLEGAFHVRQVASRAGRLVNCPPCSGLLGSEGTGPRRLLRCG